MRVLVVDDDAAMQRALLRLLAAHGMVAIATSLERWSTASGHFDAAAVSCNPPARDVIAAIMARRAGFAGPIVCYSALHWSDDECAAALDVGADAFIAFPFFRGGVVVSQFRALVRRAHAGADGGSFFVEDLEVDLIARSVLRGGFDVASLTRNEATILKTLVESHPKPASYDRLHAALAWKVSTAESRALKQAIVRLRRKLGGRAAIECVTGFGYRLARKR